MMRQVQAAWKHGLGHALRSSEGRGDGLLAAMRARVNGPTLVLVDFLLCPCARGRHETLLFRSSLRVAPSSALTQIGQRYHVGGWGLGHAPAL